MLGGVVTKRVKDDCKYFRTTHQLLFKRPFRRGKTKTRSKRESTGKNEAAISAVPPYVPLLPRVR